MVVELLQSSPIAEDSQQQVCVLALLLWDQRPNIRAILTLLQDRREKAPEMLHANVLSGGKVRSNSNGVRTLAELTVCGRGPAAAFHPGSSAVEEEAKHFVLYSL